MSVLDRLPDELIELITTFVKDPLTQWLLKNTNRKFRDAVRALPLPRVKLAYNKEYWLWETAATTNNIGALKFLLQNKMPGYSSRVVNIAAKKGRLAAVRLLIHTCKKPSRLLEIAADNGHLKLMTWLADNTNAVCTAATLPRAIKCNDVPVVRWLCQRYTYNKYVIACSMNVTRKTPMLEALIEDYDEDDVLHTAALHGHSHAVKWLCATRSDLDFAAAKLCAVENASNVYRRPKDFSLTLRWLDRKISKNV